jgi:glycosyltransferase involved in cell wall biosynthesis
MADLYLSASHTDGSSVSLLEAMASGCPVVVSDIPGNREWVRSGVNGWLFKDGDSNAMAQSILLAIETRGTLAEMGMAARQIAEQRADWRKNFPKLIQAYFLAMSS